MLDITMVKNVLIENTVFRRKYDVHSDEDDRMIFVKVVIIDCVIFNMYIGCVQHVFFPFAMRYKHQPHGKVACCWKIYRQPT